MSSKVRVSLLLTSLALGVLSCAPKVGEEAPPPKQQEFAGTAWLTDATEVIGRFLDGEARDSQLQGAWACFAGAFEAFDKYVRGSSRDSYTPAEMAGFFENEFIARRPDGSIHAIPPSLQVELMKLKQLVAGGSLTAITREEIRSVIKKIDRFEDLTLKVNPYMKVLLTKWAPQAAIEGLSDTRDIAHFEAANRTLQVVARELGQLIEESGQSYRLDDTVVLLRELSSYIGSEWEVTGAVARFMPLAKKLKKSLTGGNEEEILATEWKLVMVTGLRSYFQYLRYYYFVELPENVSREQRLTAVTRIMEESMSIIEGLVREKSDGAVSREEIDEVLRVLSEAFPVFKTSSALTTELMKVKVLLFGGAADRIAASDFEKARLKVSRIKGMLDILAPYARIYSGDWGGGKPKSSSENFKEFENAKQALARAASEFGGLLELSQGPSYDLKSLLNLTREWEKLYPSAKDSKSFGRQLATYFPLILTLKNFVYADKDSVIRDSQWASLLSLGSRFYMTGMYHTYFVGGKDMRQAGTLWNFRSFVSEAMELGQQIVQTNPNHYFPRWEVARLLGEANKLDLLPGGLSNKVLEQTLKPILNRVLNPPQKRLAGQRPDALRQSSLETLRTELLIWVDTAIFLANTFEGSDDVTMKAASLQGAIDRQLSKKSTSDTMRIGLNELKSIFNTSQSFVLDREKRLFISTAGRLKYNYRTVERHNIIRAMSRIFIASYANETSRIRRYQGVTLGEASTAFNELRGVGISLGLLEPGNSGFMESRFREANLFMPRSDGNGLASFLETHELIFSIMSGLVLDKKLNGPLRKVCAGGRKSNNFRVGLDCMYSVYRSEFPKHLRSMPDLLAFQQRSSNENFSQFFYNTLKGSGWLPNSYKHVSFGDASLLPQLLQYIEIMFARFDVDHNGGISAGEAVRAFPVFERLFREMAKADLESGRIKESELPALFTYILRYGKPPGGVWEGLTRWYPWKDNPAKWDVFADRAMMAQILGFISDSLNGSVMVPPAKGPQDPRLKDPPAGLY